MMVVNLSPRFLGSMKQAYVGMARMTALINTSLPARDKYFNFHPWSLLKALSTKKLYASDVDLPQMEGKAQIFGVVFQHMDIEEITGAR